MMANDKSTSSTKTADPLEDVKSNEPSKENPVSNPTATPAGEAPESNGEAAAAAKPAKNSRPTPPEGYVTPVDLAHKISKEFNLTPELRPQMVYGWLKNNKSFPVVDSTTLGETTSRPLVKLVDGLQFYRDLEGRRAERAAKAATAAAAPVPEGEAQPATESPSSAA